MLTISLLALCVAAVVLLRAGEPAHLGSGAAAAATFWTAALVAVLISEDEAASSIPVAVHATLVPIALAACATAVALVVALGREAALSRLGLAGAGVSLLLFAAALALRWLLPVHTLIHENRHGFWLTPQASGVMALEAHGAVSAHMLLARLLHLTLPAVETPIFLAGALWSSLAVVGIFWLARQAFDSSLAGWTCAVLLMLQPVALLMAPTEEYMNTAVGAALAGMALVFHGARRAVPWTLLAGAGFIVIAASVRDVALPLVLLLPLTVVAATGRVRPRPAEALACLLAALLCLPRALVFLAALREQHTGLAFIGLPDLPLVMEQGRLVLSRRWAGWQDPFLPRWVTLSALGGLALLLGWSLRRRQWQSALLVVGAFTTAYLTAMIVRDGWFPTHLRHQLVGCALLVLPLGWLAGTLERRVAGRARRLAALPAFALPLAAGALSLAAGEGYRVDAPMVEEYRFFARETAALPADARLVRPRHAEGPLAALPHYSEWLAAHRRGPRILEPEAFLRNVRGGSEQPAYFLLDRLCFVDIPCFERPRHCRQERPEPSPLVETAFGMLHPHCARLLEAVPWETVSRHTLRQGSRPQVTPFDLPQHGPSGEIAVLRWTGAALRAAAEPGP